jgi:hypothetical protein
MLEYCVCCQACGPPWNDPGYAEWHLVVTPDGDYLGVVCAGCHVDDELAFDGFPSESAPADQLSRRRAARGRSGATATRPDRAAA